MRKYTRVIVIAAILIAIGLGVQMMSGVSRDINLVMGGNNLSEIDPNAIIQHITEITGAENDNVFAQFPFREIVVDGDFNWMDSAAIDIGVNKRSFRRYTYHTGQLRIFPDEGIYSVTDTQRQYDSDHKYLLQPHLCALKYLPQDEIQNSLSPKPDAYIISVRDDGSIADGQPCIYYNKDGLREPDGYMVQLDIMPLYGSEASEGFDGVGEDIIHALYGD